MAKLHAFKSEQFTEKGVRVYNEQDIIVMLNRRFPQLMANLSLMDRPNTTPEIYDTAIEESRQVEQIFLQIVNYSQSRCEKMRMFFQNYRNMVADLKAKNQATNTSTSTTENTL